MLLFLGSFQQIISYFIFIAVVFLALAGAGLFIARSRQTGSMPVFQTPLYPVPPAIFLTLMAALLFLLVMHSPRQAMLGTAVVAAGVPVFKLFSRSRHQAVHTAEVLEEV